MEGLWTSECTWKQACVLSFVLLLERWFGRTDKVKSNSILDFVINLGLDIGSALITKWRKK